MSAADGDSTAMLDGLYHPRPPRQVGILSIAGALEPHARDVDAVLGAAGHTSLRRFGRMQTRVGEVELRREDVLEFLELYAHEYALVAFRSWPGSRSAEPELIAAGVSQGCRVLWMLQPGDPRDTIEGAGASVR